MLPPDLLARDKGGRVLTDAYLRVKRGDGSDAPLPNVFSLGDCANVNGVNHPPTAQVAEKQGLHLAKRCGGVGCGMFSLHTLLVRCALLCVGPCLFFVCELGAMWDVGVFFLSFSASHSSTHPLSLTRPHSISPLFFFLCTLCASVPFPCCCRLVVVFGRAECNLREVVATTQPPPTVAPTG
jgi:hypothetical protein